MNIVIALLLIVCGVGLVPTWIKDEKTGAAVAFKPLGILYSSALIAAGVFVYLLTEGYLR